MLPTFTQSRSLHSFIHSFIYLFIYLFIYGCVGSSFLCEGFPQPRQAGATLHRSARASHHRGLSCCRAQAPDAQAQQLWLMGPVAPRHVGSSQTRARTPVPRIGRRILNHCATREAHRSLHSYLEAATKRNVAYISSSPSFYTFVSFMNTKNIYSIALGSIYINAILQYESF